MSEEESKFHEIISQGLTSDDLSKFETDGKLLDNNFLGPYASEIETWREKGYGRLVKVVQDGDDHDHFRNVMYVLPYSEVRQNRLTSALILFPDKDGVNACIVEVERDTSSEKRIAPAFDAYAQFSKCFAPGKEDYIANWKPDPSKQLYEAFLESVGEFSAMTKIKSIPESHLRPIIDRAVNRAKQIRE